MIIGNHSINGPILIEERWCINMYVYFRILDHDKTKNIAGKSFQITISAFELHMVIVVAVNDRCAFSEQSWVKQCQSWVQKGRE